MAGTAPNTTAAAWLKAVIDNPDTAPGVTVKRLPQQSELPGAVYECQYGNTTILVAEHQYASTGGHLGEYGGSISTTWATWYSVDVLGGDGDNVIWCETETHSGAISALVQSLGRLHGKRIAAEQARLVAQFARAPGVEKTSEGLS